MTIEQTQKLDRSQVATTKFMATLIRFILAPFLLMLWYYMVMVLPFGLVPLTYLQSFILMLGINLIKEL